MGGYDLHCAICGGPSHKPYWNPEDDGGEPDYQYDPDLIAPEETEWMADVHLLGENPDCDADDKTYLSGRASYDDAGFFSLEESDDPNFFEGEQNSLRGYEWEDDIPFAVPMHKACWDLLCKKVGGPQALKRDHLYQTMKKLCPGVGDRCLEIDYGAAAECQDQYWITKRGTEHVVSHPIDIPQLREYYASLPLLRTAAAAEARATPVSGHPASPSSSSRDVFATLAPEMCLSIMDCLDVTSLLHLRAASKAAQCVSLGQGFWKARLATDMPWLYDFPPQTDGDKQPIDWELAYRHLYAASQPATTTAATLAGKIPGLCNRRRIWEGTLPQILDPYRARVAKEERESRRREIPPALQKATAGKSPRLVVPDPLSPEQVSVPLLHDFPDLDGAAEPVLRTHWTEAGLLAGISVRNRSRSGDLPYKAGCCHGGMAAAAGGDVVVPRDDWITGFVVTTRDVEGKPAEEGKAKAKGKGKKGQQPTRAITGLTVLFAKAKTSAQQGDVAGDQRLLTVAQDKFIVGLRVEIDRSDEDDDDGEEGGDALVSKITLLQQPRNLAPHGTRRIIDANRGALNPRARDYLWRGELLAPGPQPLAVQNGYWKHDMKVDVSPMEALLFGEDDRANESGESISLRDVRGLSADVHFGGFAVHYTNASGRSCSRTIGPRHHGMKHLSIDGAGGERVAAIHFNVAHIPDRVRFVTNRGRQLVVGHPHNGHEGHSLPALGGPGASRVPAGLFGWWSRREGVQANFDALGFLAHPESAGPPSAMNDHLPATATGQVDSRGLLWEPAPPPEAQLTENGAARLWGEATIEPGFNRRILSVPSASSVASWLDCSRPLAAVTATTCHATRRDAIPLSGLCFTFADNDDENGGRTQSFGPTEVTQPADAEGKNGHPWCWCALGSKRPDELEGRPHFVQETWEVGGGGSGGKGRRLGKMLVWLAEKERILAGLQLVDEVGDKSPAWGFCSGEPAGAIVFAANSDGNGSEAMGGGRRQCGIKVYTDSNGRCVTRDDSVLVAVQGLGAVADVEFGSG